MSGTSEKKTARSPSGADCRTAITAVPSSRKRRLASPACTFSHIMQPRLPRRVTSSKQSAYQKKDLFVKKMSGIKNRRKVLFVVTYRCLHRRCLTGGASAASGGHCNCREMNFQSFRVETEVVSPSSALASDFSIGPGFACEACSTFRCAARSISSRTAMWSSRRDTSCG
jgi:hypothetical protein